MEIIKVKTIDDLNSTVATWITEHINETLQKQDRYTIALSGGNTPKSLHRLLASDAYRNKIDWSKLHIFWGDERHVPFEDERNNAKMAYDTLLNFVDVPASQIHVMRTDIPAEESAAEYEKILRAYFTDAPTTFDLVLLGIGDDAHTLSLFPGKREVIHEQEKWATSLWLESQNMYRVTLTAPVVNKSARVAFVLAGGSKAPAIKHVLQGEYNPDLYPSQVIKPSPGELFWFLEEAAGALV
ncbi:6-phosphogluconolactonase [Foetidibacter luteolus]|uniref:6-phosphogluconolactonase n=1 Tax=Foetidibacter luteolus TaxID=2608880 RepID=UPI00129AB472|nr:6-phosphogluconolactonase [Foetidibacter luteolus]